MTVEEEIHLFDSGRYISTEIQSTLPPNYLIRSLKRNDDQFGFIELLSELSTIGNITHELYQCKSFFFPRKRSLNYIVCTDRFDLLKKTQNTFVIVIENDHKEIIASATLVVEYKFLHECGNVGHIEDVVVHDSQRGKRLGIRLA
jgi:glucosamine-phosphate N-acetyltransferase